MNPKFRDELLAKGWTVGADGQLYHPRARPVVAGEREQPPRPLVGQTPAVEGGGSGVGGGDARSRRSRPAARSGLAPEWLINLISLRRRRIDQGNLETGFKALQDAIAARLGVNDGDSRIEWEYGQTVSTEPATVVLIRRL